MKTPRRLHADADSNSAAVDVIVRNQQEKTRESVLAEYPVLANEDNPAGLLSQGTFAYSTNKEKNPGRAAGSRSSWNLTTADGIAVTGD